MEENKLASSLHVAGHQGRHTRVKAMSKGMEKKKDRDKSRSPNWKRVLSFLGSSHRRLPLLLPSLWRTSPVTQPPSHLALFSLSLFFNPSLLNQWIPAKHSHCIIRFQKWLHEINAHTAPIHVYTKCRCTHEHTCILFPLCCTAPPASHGVCSALIMRRMRDCFGINCN